MACGGCRKSGGNTGPRTSDLRKFAFLTPRQLRILEQEDEAAKKVQEQSEEQGGGE